MVDAPCPLPSPAVGSVIASMVFTPFAYAATDERG